MTVTWGGRYGASSCRNQPPPNLQVAAGDVDRVVLLTKAWEEICQEQHVTFPLFFEEQVIAMPQLNLWTWP